MDDLFAADCFAGQTVLVTGGGTGLGIEISRLLAGHGARVAIASRSAENHVEFMEQAGRENWEAMAAVFDVREPDQVGKVCAQVAERFGSLDILINNAAGNFIRPAMDLPAKGWRAVIDIALSGVFYCSQAAGRIMREQESGGAIVNIIAPYAWTGCPGVVHSASAKAGVLAMTKTLAVEWAAYGIRVNAVAPGPFESKGAASRLWPTPEIRAAIEGQIPAGRFADTAEVAGAVAYLASRQAAYITGTELTIDGGWTLGKSLVGNIDVSAVPRRRD
jgi:NAD(P)-dependent dehydrogenase (short-subunit alcohol dehydrogenase family)